MSAADDKIIDLLKKINALAQKGVDGERENARERLVALMNKYGVTLDMLEADTKSERVFTITKEQKQFFTQIVYSVCGRVDIFYYKSELRKKASKRIIEMTEIEYIEVREKFDFYWQKYQKDLVLFYKAFIHKNNLTTKLTQEQRAELKPTPEELEEYEKVRSMMHGMEEYKLQKRLTNS